MQPKRAFSLFSMSVLAGFLQRWNELFVEATNKVHKDAPDMVKKFMSQPPSKVAVADASWLTIAAGMFTSAGAFLGGRDGGIANTVAGVFTVAAGSVGSDWENPPEDPRFDDFATLSSKLSKITDIVTGAITAYYDRLFQDNPAKGDEAAATELARLLESGLFANYGFGVIGDEKIVPKDMQNMTYAAIIAEAWNNGRVAMAKWGKNNGVAKWGLDPCHRDDKDDEKNLGIADIVGCYNDLNYLIVSISMFSFPFFLLEKKTPLTHLPPTDHLPD